jgi:tricorn protease
LLLFVARSFAESPRGYYRFPTIHGDTIVFTAEGDLWRVPATGGVAQRLTTHPGLESHAAIAPDGLTVAFSAQYEGPTEVYTMPLAGGLPIRHTFEGDNARVEGWTPDGKLLYATDVHSTLPNHQLVELDPKTDHRRLLPLAQASQGAVEPEGAGKRTLVFTRFSKQGSSTKRYQGGWVENLWRFTDGDTEAAPLTASYTGTRRSTMWWKGRIHFASDRDGVMNLWSMKRDGSDLVQLTKHKGFDVKSPAQQGGRIVYQHGADLRLFGIAGGVDHPLDIRLASDFDQKREKWVRKPLEFLTSAHLSPNGDRVVFTARGQVFVAPVEQGRFVEVPRKQDVRYRDAQFLPDGKSLLALSDETGELEFWKLPANGIGAAAHLTTNGTVFRFPASPSPDGKRLVWTDKDHKLWVHEIATSKTTLIDETTSRSGFDDFVWSPDGQWIAYTKAAPNLVQQVNLYRPSDGARAVPTSDRVESYSPAWSPDGKWLYFLSDRELKSLVSSPWGPRQPEPFFTEVTKIYALALTKGQRWPFAPADELHSPKAATKKDEKEDDADQPRTDEPKSDGAEKEEGDAAADSKSKAKDKAPKTPAVDIELEGLAARLFEAPVPAGNYSNLRVTAKHLLYTAREVGFSAKSHLKQLEITNKDPKAKTLVEEARQWELSLDGKKVFVRKGEGFYVIAAGGSAPAKLDDKVDLGGWTFSITPREEWRQIYTESWRMIRDYFYDRGMHGLDWPRIRLKYLPLIDRVSDRAELSDVIYEMIGELSTLHIYVAAGDLREGTDKVSPASLGARMVYDNSAGGWRVEHVYRGDPDYPDQLAPLARPGVEVGDGDVITAIDGRSVLEVRHPEMLLRNRAGRHVLLDIKPRGGGATRQDVVEPIGAGRETDLRYD